jgi:hypothetical protein
VANTTYQAYVQSLGAASALTGAELIALIQSGNPVQIALNNLNIALNSTTAPPNGIYVPVANTIGFSNNSIQTGTLTSAAMTMPAYAVTGSSVPANGIYLPSANTVGFATNSVQAGTISATRQWQLYEPNFSAAALKQAATMDSGSFTGTFTGMTGTVTGTINWTRSGNLVTLRAATAITGTSNANTMTMTGLPAALSPFAEVKGISGVTDSGNTDIPGQVDITAGSTTLLFFKYNGTQYLQNAFTATGTKGIASGWTYSYTLQ